MNNLTQVYDQLKNDVKSQNNLQDRGVQLKTPPSSSAIVRHIHSEGDKFKEACCKRILLDIYCKILPLDKDYICGHQGQMKGDMDSFLKNKDQSATQYITGAYERTNAPLLEFILRGTNILKESFIKEAQEEVKDAKENKIDPPPISADTDETNVDSQIVDVTNDEEYSNFVEKLKKKTVDKIVKDVTEIIKDSKVTKDMTFDPQPDGITESTISIGMNYLTRKLLKENVEINNKMQEEMIGIAIRETALNQLDVVFNSPEASLKNYKSRVNYNKGYVLNESALNNLKSALQSIS